MPHLGPTEELSWLVFALTLTLPHLESLVMGKAWSARPFISLEWFLLEMTLHIGKRLETIAAVFVQPV